MCYCGTDHFTIRSLCYRCHFIINFVYIREEKVRNRVLRIFKIWEERDVYSNSFVDELSVLLDSPLQTETKPTVKQSSDFEVNNFNTLK